MKAALAFVVYQLLYINYLLRNNTVIFMSLRAIQYERRLKCKSAFIIQKIDPFEMVLVNSLRTLTDSVLGLFTRTISLIRIDFFVK